MFTTTTTTTTGNFVLVSRGSTATLEKKTYVPSVEIDVVKALTLSWWEIYGFTRYGGYPTFARYEAKGWLGLTVINLSEYELSEVRRWQKQRGKDMVYLSKRDWGRSGEKFVTHFLGSYRDYDVCLWFATPALRDAFIAFLESFPVRTAALLVDDGTDAKPFLKGTNYKLLKGSMKSAIGYTSEVGDADLVALKLMMG